MGAEARAETGAPVLAQRAERFCSSAAVETRLRPLAQARCPHRPEKLNREAQLDAGCNTRREHACSAQRESYLEQFCPAPRK